MSPENSPNLPQNTISTEIQNILNGLEKTDHPCVYLANKFEIDPNKATVVILFGPSGVGKDTVLAHLVSKNLGVHTVTATTRDPRVGESHKAYTWMRKRHLCEKKYFDHLVEEYHLVEYDKHCGEFYGLPMENIYLSAKIGTPIIRNEINGARTILSKLSNDFNVIAVGLLPDNNVQLWERIQGRKNELIRYQEAVEMIPEVPKVAHIVLHNPIFEDGLPVQLGLSGAEYIFSQLIKSKNSPLQNE